MKYTKKWKIVTIIVAVVIILGISAKFIVDKLFSLIFFSNIADIEIDFEDLTTLIPDSSENELLNAAVNGDDYSEAKDEGNASSYSLESETVAKTKTIGDKTGLNSDNQKASVPQTVNVSGLGAKSKENGENENPESTITGTKEENVVTETKSERETDNEDNEIIKASENDNEDDERIEENERIAEKNVFQEESTEWKNELESYEGENQNNVSNTEIIKGKDTIDIDTNKSTINNTAYINMESGISEIIEDDRAAWFDSIEAQNAGSFNTQTQTNKNADGASSNSSLGATGGSAQGGNNTSSDNSIDVTKDKIAEAEKQVSTGDKLKAIGIIFGKLQPSEIETLMNLARKGKVTQEDINAAKNIIKQKVTEEEKEVLKELFNKYQYLID